MIKYTLVHPQILSVLARAGHHDRVLIADGNYPALGTLGPRAELVSLNLMPGVVDCVTALKAVLSAVVVERCYVMQPEGDDPSLGFTGDPPIWRDFEQAFKSASNHLEWTRLGKWHFYDHVNTPRHVLTIQTGEMMPYANILLELGCRR